MTTPNILLWYRRDLRLRDHQPLTKACRQKGRIFPLYCFDPREFMPLELGFPKTGSIRAQFLLESVQDLRHNLQQYDSNLLIRQGKPEVIIPKLCGQWQIDVVYWEGAVTAEERDIEQNLSRALRQQGVQFEIFWTNSLHDRQTLPFPPSAVPEVFTQFRKQVESQAAIALPVPIPRRISPLTESVEPGELPSLEALGLERSPSDSREACRFVGGETAGWQRLHEYFWQGDRLKIYKQTRNGLLGANYSSKFSPWLAFGCVSARDIAAEVKRYEEQRVANESTYWLIFELLWRDYFYWICAKHGNRVFQAAGLRGIKLPWRQDQLEFEQWKTGQTGIPFVDANMRELALTGFMSNRGRQNVASFLTKNLGLDWRWGAAWFESQLIDYDVCSNWGNWNYTAGVGNDHRGFRYFNIPKQAKDYDPSGDYVRHWLPELAGLRGDTVHQPWRRSPQQLSSAGITLGQTYPKPMVDLRQSVTENREAYETACRKTSP